MSRCLLLGLFVGFCCFGQVESAGNLIGNGSFSRDLDVWSQWFAPGSATGEAVWEKRGDGGMMRVRVERRLRSSSVQIYNGGFAVEAKKWYSLEFEAKAEEDMSLDVSLMGNEAPYRALGLRVSPRVMTRWRNYVYLVQCLRDEANARIDFFVPEGCLYVDNVVLRPLAADPETHVVEKVMLGKSVSGRAENLIDGDPKTRVWLGGYPVMPGMVTLDLGREKAIGGIEVTSEDWGRHLSLERMECEVSRDGANWRRWARFGKARGEKSGNRVPTRFSAFGEAVSARYIRLRVTRVKNSGRLFEAVVFAAESADSAVFDGLENVPASSALTFQGGDYAQNGYDFSPGEQVKLCFVNMGNAAVEAELNWELQSYAGDALEQGKALVAAKAEEIARIPLNFTTELRDGPYRVRFFFSDREAEKEAFQFDFRKAEARAGISVLKLAAYLDIQDPEGWVRLSAGPLAASLNVHRRLNAGFAPDAILVASEAWKAEDPRVHEVRNYVEQGGVALVYGKVSAGFDELLPVKINREEPFSKTLLTLEEGALGLVGKPLPQRAVCATPVPGAKVLATWSDGTSAVVEGRFGKGRVVFVGAGLGHVWTKEGLAQLPADRLTFPLLYELVHGKAAGEAVRKLYSDQSGNWCAQSPDTLSLGRFGWKVAEGGLVENMDALGQLHCPVDRSVCRIGIPGREIARGVPQSVNWLSKKTRWLDAEGRDLFATTLSMGAPCILWETGERVVEIDCRGESFFCEQNGRIEKIEAGQAVSGADLSAGWLVIPRDKVAALGGPRYVQFARRPQGLELVDGVLRVTFAKACGAFWTGRLFGIRRFPENVSGIGEEAFAQAKRLSRLCLAFPVNVRETGNQVQGEAFWRIENRFEFREIPDAFGTEAVKMAPVPPVLALAHAHAPTLARIVGGKSENLWVATKYGPLTAVPGERLVYEISQLSDEHFGVVPGTNDAAVRKLADHHGGLCLKVGLRAPSGLVSGGSSYLADLREYMSCSRFKPLFSAPCLDLYKWWYCFPSVMGRPIYSPASRKAIDGHYRKVFRDTLEMYSYKTIVRYRREPWTGKDYSVSFIWPVSWKEGCRFFVDQNESAAVIEYCLWAYAQYYGDWDTVRSNWHLARWIWAYLPRIHDWAVMCSSNQSYFSTVGIDMLNSEYPGNLAMARMARMVGDADSERLARHLAAKAAIPALARFLLPAYTRSITGKGDPWRDYKYFWSMNEGSFSGSKSIIMRGDSWSILQLGIGMYDTSKGTSPEIVALYRNFIPQLLEAYERDLQKEEEKLGKTVAWAHLMSRGFMGWPREELIATAQKNTETVGGMGWQSTKYPHNLGAMATAGNGFHLLDWSPAAYEFGEFDAEKRIVKLRFAHQGKAAVRLQAHSAYAVTKLEAENGRVIYWSDDPAKGLLEAEIEADGMFTVTLKLDGKRRKIPCIYCR